MDWRKKRGFFFGSLLGGLLGALMVPGRRRRLIIDPALRHLEETHAFSSAPCYRPDDTFT